MIRKILDKIKRKDKQEKEEEPKTISKIVFGFISFAPAIMLMTLFYMGALSNQSDISYEEYKLNITQSFDIVADAGVEVVMTFYENGRDNPRVFTLIFWGSIIMWFYYPISDTIKYIKQRQKKRYEHKSIKLDSALDLAGSALQVVT